MSDTTNELERAVGQLRDIRAVMAQHGRSVATLSWTLLDALLSGIAEQSRRIAVLEAAAAEKHAALKWVQAWAAHPQMHGGPTVLTVVEKALLPAAGRTLLEWVEGATEAMGYVANQGFPEPYWIERMKELLASSPAEGGAKPLNSQNPNDTVKEA
jgi:hypothetical protein